MDRAELTKTIQGYVAWPEGIDPKDRDFILNAADEYARSRCVEELEKVRLSTPKAQTYHDYSVGWEACEEEASKLIDQAIAALKAEEAE